jgi:signal transduction histidine kinase
LPDVLANEAALTQCFSNLLNNAVKFVAPGTKPRVRISAERRGERVRFWFADNGIGVPEQYQEKIFGTFERIDTSFEGTGIGLTIVRKAIERMDGQAGVESAPGHGCRFWLELKAANETQRR